MKQILFLFLILVFSFKLYSQHSKPDTLIALFSNEQIILDGKLNEACWQKAPLIENFTQREQTEGAPATERTRVAVVYSTNEIYFGIWCYDSEPNKLSAQQMARDFNWGSDDNFEIMISTFNDNRNGYLFVTNPNGARADVWVGDEGHDFNKDWNGVWDVAVDVNDEGWFVEMVIPFSTLKFKKDSLQTWGINFERNIRRKKEQLMWQGWSRLYDVEKISQGGKLSGIKNIRQGSKIEIKPYLLSGIQFFEENTTTTTKVGGEVNFDITPTLKLNFSINTDFAQVESDRQQINLSRFSLYYPEKRQFFLEGKNYYDMNLGRSQLFYSRRIGIDDETEVPIIGGVRMFGKLNKTNIGIMSIQTSSKDSIPTTNYTVIKVKQDIWKQSSIGVIAMQKYSGEHYNRVYGANFVYSTSELFGEKNLVTGASFAISDTKAMDGEESPNKNNFAYNLFINYPNDLIDFRAGLHMVKADFNPEMGYFRRKNYQVFYSELEIKPRFKKLPFLRNMTFVPFDMRYYINDETKKMESFFYEWKPLGFTTMSGESFEFAVKHSFDKPDEDFELIDDVIIPADGYWDNRFEAEFSTFKGRKISGEISVSIGEFYTGSRQEIQLNLNFNLNKRLNIGLDWERNYLQFPEKSLKTDGIGGRIDYSFNPKFQSSLFAQWNNEDNIILLNYRINWIPEIGSFFYFVINQEISTDGKIKLERTTIMAKLIWRFAI